MKRKERYIVGLDEVTITRDGDYALIEYKEEGVRSTFQPETFPALPGSMREKE